MIAAYNGKLKCLDYLIAMGANLDATNQVSATPAPAACWLAARRPYCWAAPHPRACGVAE